jgi:hypothetical protein
MMDMRDKVYARREFLEHFKWCEHAQACGGRVWVGRLCRGVYLVCANKDVDIQRLK